MTRRLKCRRPYKAGGGWLCQPRTKSDTELLFSKETAVPNFSFQNTYFFQLGSLSGMVFIAWFHIIIGLQINCIRKMKIFCKGNAPILGRLFFRLILEKRFKRGQGTFAKYCFIVSAASNLIKSQDVFKKNNETNLQIISSLETKVNECNVWYHRRQEKEYSTKIACRYYFVVSRKQSSCTAQTI